MHDDEDSGREQHKDDDEKERQLDEMLDGRAFPRFALPHFATLFEFGIEHDEVGDPLVTPFDLVGDQQLIELVEAVPEQARTLRMLPDRPPHSQSGDWGWILGTLANILQVAGVPGMLVVGQKVREWLRGRKGRSGDLGALLPVAVYHLTREHPDAKPDLSRVQSLDPVQPPSPRRRYPLDHQVVYIFRFYDLNGESVYVVEVDSFGECVTCVKRPIRLFEAPGFFENPR